ncbi:MAG: peptidoglycan DD-metalloendopeptidase family protein [Chloroflexi bacterium]|nr:peptidoglycan DD-metalloendopeptidase family protein [Chloroflexota bacterium]MCC6892004.1 peptidoglycan DD-metalloendopeptidase family protein [Anaerolineae bacterium]
MRRDGFPTILLVLVAVVGFGAVVWWNARPDQPTSIIIIPTMMVPTEDPNSWQTVLQVGFGSNSTPLPTVAIPTASFVPPTIPGSSDTNLTPIAPLQLTTTAQTQPNGVVTPTPLAGTLVSQATGLPVTEQFVTRPPSQWQPPPLIPPISRDPYGRDHFVFARPVDSNATNAALPSYTFGSDGPQQESPWRVHHGIDMPNPIGQTVRAAGVGTVIWAGSGFQDSPSYGNVVQIQHDFGYNGEPLYTLYAHLSAVLVTQGQRVNLGDPIGLVGNTGRVSGPHVHFEVRVGENRYRDTYNPLLWMVPYVGHGVIAGRVIGPTGQGLQDQTVTVMDYNTGLVVQSTTTYIYLDNGSDVQADPNWQENFVLGDIPVGRYTVITNIDGQRVTRRVDVAEGMTTFIDLSLTEPTPTPSATAEQ